MTTKSTHHLTKAELEYYVNAKAWTSEEPGYFRDGKLVLNRLYKARLGTKYVGIGEGLPSYRPDAGGYLFRDEALKGAKLFREKMREFLDAGNYADAEAAE